MNPSTPDSPATGAVAAEEFLTSELAATRRALQRTRIAGVVILAVVFGYMSFVTLALQKHLEPKSAAEFAADFTAGQVVQKADALASQIKERIPALVAGLPEYLQRELPTYREKLEERIEQDFRQHCSTTSQQLGKHLDDFLQAHVVQIRTLLKMADQKPEDWQTLAPDLEQELLRYLSDKSEGDESLKDKIDHALIELQRVEKQAGRLARGADLTPQEKKVRHATALIARGAEQQTRQLQMQIEDAMRKAK